MTSAFRAQSSGEVFVLDKTRTLIYRGPLSDQFGIGYALTHPRHEYLKDALEAVLLRQPLPFIARTAPGCALGLPPRTTAAEAPVTFHNRISRLLPMNCQNCHRAGEAGPFPLTTYEDVRGHAGMVSYVVGKKTMPPWFASGAHGDWANDASLYKEDRQALLGWLCGGIPEGDRKDAPLA